MQYMGLCVFSLPISNMMIVRIRVLYLIIIIKTEVWLICHYLGLGHETMVCAVCLFIFFFELLPQYRDKYFKVILYQANVFVSVLEYHDLKYQECVSCYNHMIITLYTRVGCWFSLQGNTAGTWWKLKPWYKKIYKNKVALFTCCPRQQSSFNLYVIRVWLNLP